MNVTIVTAYPQMVFFFNDNSMSPEEGKREVLSGLGNEMKGAKRYI